MKRLVVPAVLCAGLIACGARESVAPMEPPSAVYGRVTEPRMPVARWTPPPTPVALSTRTPQATVTPVFVAVRTIAPLDLSKKPRRTPTLDFDISPDRYSQLMVGFLESVDADGNVRGWAADTDALDEPATVRIWLDGPIGSEHGRYVGKVQANLARSDVARAGYPGAHGFVYSFPLEYRDGAEHLVYAYGYSVSKTGSRWSQLIGSPKVASLPRPKK